MAPSVMRVRVTGFPLSSVLPVSISSVMALKRPMLAEPISGSSQRRTLAATSSAVKRSPFDQRTFRRRLKVQVFRSSLVDQVSAK